MNNNSTTTIIYLVIAVIEIVALWVLFGKANKPGWAAIIPIYNAYIWLQIIGRPGWWLILLIVPFVNIYVILVMYTELAKVFGKGTGFGCLMIIFPYIFFPILAFGDSTYEGAIAH